MNRRVIFHNAVAFAAALLYNVSEIIFRHKPIGDIFMTHEEILSYCLQKRGAYTDYPFGPDCTCVKVRARLFAQLFILNGVPSLTLNYDAMTGEFYRSIYPDAVRRGYHCPPVQQPYFNTIDLEKAVPDEELFRMIDHSYTYVVGKLTKKLQRELQQE